ncbi:MAG: hypothetical protein N3A66_02980 [Planctomycetota bacterium]|nr:hypothetical protein [Planctomycetota bacterium]
MAATSIFLAGIIQGSLANGIHAQDYRAELTALLKAYLPQAEIYDPFQEHPNSLRYDESRGRQVFFDLMARAGQADVLIAFVPEASMGTAIELWNAYRAGALVICISPLRDNWVVRFLADILLPDLAAFRAFVATGRLQKMIEARAAGQLRRPSL